MVAKSSTSRGRSRHDSHVSTEDALAVGMLRSIDWARRHQRGVILAALLAVALVAGFIYYRDYRRNLTARAATQLDQLEAQIATAGTPTAAVGRLKDYLNRFGGTPSADDARLLLARIQLDQNAPKDALQVLEPLSGRPIDTPIGYSAARLRADAYSAAGDRPRAMQVLDDAARNARFAFQRDDASAELADLLVLGGSYDSAAAIYRRLASDSAGTAGENNTYSLRLGEVLAMKAAGVKPPQGPPADTARPDTTLSGGIVPGAAPGASGLSRPGNPSGDSASAGPADTSGGGSG